MPFFRRKPRFQSSSREVYVNHKYPPDVVVVPENFPSNKIITSKYTVWNFLIKNLYEQFRRIANFYFLCIAVVQLSIKSPVSPATSLTPLIFVVLVTAIKQAYEDWLRHKSDKIVNTKSSLIYQSGKLVSIESQDIKVGDIVMIRSDEEVPCDLVLLSSSDSDGICYVTTANLDGETNLKIQRCLEETKSYQTVESFNNLLAVIECELPHPDLYKFIGKMTIYSDSCERNVSSLGSVNLLLKGSRLKNTTFVFGCAVYTGQDTKMALNLRLTSNKFSTVEKSLNTFLIIFLIILLIETSTGTILMIFYNAVELDEEAWYIPKDIRPSAGNIIENFLSFAVLFNYIIPISLYVTLEMIKFIGAKFFIWDLELYNEDTDEPAVCNSSDLNEELGQVEYLFTDKTGTLTENEMQFRKCTVNGIDYEECGRTLCIVGGEPIEECPEALEHFLVVLCLCNTVQINKLESNNIDNFDEIPEYQASSPDEKALVEACARVGVVLAAISGNTYIVQTKSGAKTFKKLQTLEFDSVRKRMSTIVQNEAGDIYLMCKGADTTVLPLINSGPVQDIKERIGNYSLDGLRTLVIAEKHMSEKQYKELDEKLQEARNQLHERETLVAQVFDAAEQRLSLLGATAIEDRLQVGVADTLQALRVAGINIWVLTGDSCDTAINISYACGHFKREMVRLNVVNQQTPDDSYYSLKSHELRISGDPVSTYALVIDGQSLAFSLQHHRELLRCIAVQCCAVLCCRMSPLQKAEVVKLIKYSPESPVTAAIGDGANDVSMIQEAHVGLGIMGKEGRQAVRCSDFAFSKFHFLKRVLLVHGQYYYTRAAILVQYFFYKNIAFVIPQFIFIFYNGFTPQPVYNGTFLMMYNIFFTSLPILIYGVTEKHENEEVLIENPAVYKNLSKNRYLTLAEFSKWVLQGLWHCFVFFYGVYFIWDTGAISKRNGQTLDLWCFGTVIFHLVVITVNLKLSLHTKYWTALFTAGLVTSIMGFMFFTMLYTGVYWSVETSLLYGVYLTVLNSAQIWFLTFLLTVLALLPDIIILLFERERFNLKKRLLTVLPCNNPQKSRHCLNFVFFNHNDQPNITLSQINILDQSSESIS